MTNLKRPNENQLVMAVPTTTLLPSGALLSLTKRVQGPGRWVLSDDGTGAEDVRSLGHLKLTAADLKRGRGIAEQFGLEFVAGSFLLRDVSDDQEVAAVAYLAEAVRRWSSEINQQAARQTRTTLVDAVEDRLRFAMTGVTFAREVEVVGASTKRYSFDLAGKISRDRLILFDTIAPHPAALSAAHIKLFDLKDAHPDWPREVVTERLEAWDSADMVLLAGVATHVRDLSHDWVDLRTFLH